MKELLNTLAAGDVNIADCKQERSRLTTIVQDVFFNKVR